MANSNASSSTVSGDSVPTSEATSLTALTATLSSSPQDFLLTISSLHTASLVVAKQFLDPLAASVTNSKSRMRSKQSESAVLDKIYLDGFDLDQVWEQVRLLIGEVEGSLGETLSKTLAAAQVKHTTANAKPGRKRKAVHFEGSDDDILSDEKEPDSEMDQGLEGDSELSEDLSDGEGRSDEDNEDGEEEEVEEEGIQLQDDDLEGIEDYDENDTDNEKAERQEIFVPDVHGLNDGFFSIDDFNRQTEMFEQLDYKGEDGKSDSEDELDYNVDPGQLKDIGPSNGDEDDEDSEEEDDFDEDMDGEDNANDIMYANFFAPPPKKALTASQQKKQSWKKAFLNSDPEANTQELSRIESDMARVSRDLFDDEFSEEGSDDEVGDPSEPRSRKSNYEKRQAALVEQIRQLEAANVAKKEWTLSGEARAGQRPMNSLLEEDLEFERIGKPVPVITQEVTEGLEDMIKRRIIAGDFDELQKRRPEDIGVNFKRGRFELDDSKPQQSLAEVYETEHLQSIDPGNNPSKKDEKLRKEHEDISALFNEVTRKLDALSSWHYTPKHAQPSISIVSDVAAIQMEEAQPTVSGGGASAADVSMLAPQEVYNPIKDRKEQPKVSGAVREVVGKNGAPISVAEMTSEEKQKRRKQNKERKKKENATKGLTHGAASTKTGSKKDVMDTLKKGGVQIIGKRGEKTDIQGNEIKEKKGLSSSNTFKL